MPFKISLSLWELQGNSDLVCVSEIAKKLLSILLQLFIFTLIYPWKRYSYSDVFKNFVRELFCIAVKDF